jgi:aryl-alcohol dehydrogenase-like predicted oxidoreductase
MEALREMKYRTYPKTDIRVSEVGFGLWTTSTGWWGEMTDAQAVALLHEAHDLGITLYDAADTYGNGRSEEQLAAAFAERRGRRVFDEVRLRFLHLRGRTQGPKRDPARFSRPRSCATRSNSRCGVCAPTTIDIYSIHNARLSKSRTTNSSRSSQSFRAEGKIRSYGVALGPAIGWLVEGCEAARKRNVTNVQMIWNMLEQFPGNEMLRAADAADADTGYQIRVPHSSGMLEGKYTLETTFPPNDHRRHRPRTWLVNGVRKVENLRFLENPGPHARTSGAAMAPRRTAHDDRAAEHLRPRAADRVRDRSRYGAAQPGRTRARRRACQE